MNPVRSYRCIQGVPELSAHILQTEIRLTRDDSLNELQFAMKISRKFYLFSMRLTLKEFRIKTKPK